MDFRPDKLPEWATGGSADIVEPAAGRKALGWEKDDEPPCGWLNWIKNNIYAWLLFYANLVLDNFFTVELDRTAAWTDVIYTIFKSSATAPEFYVCAGIEGIQISNSAKSGTWYETLSIGGWRCGCATNHASSKAVVAGASGAIRTTQDGATWTVRTPAASFSGTFWGAAFVQVGSPATDYIVLVGTGGTIQYSTDGGLNWSAATPAGSYNHTFYDVAWGEYGVGPIRRCVAVGANGEIQYSDGVFAGWTQATVAGGYMGDFRGVTFGSIPGITKGNKVWVAVGEDSEIQYSADGATWYQASLPTIPTGDDFLGVVWGYAGFLAAGEGGLLLGSTDGMTWRKHYSGFNQTGDNSHYAVGTDLNGYYLGAIGDGFGGTIIFSSLRAGNYD